MSTVQDHENSENPWSGDRQRRIMDRLGSLKGKIGFYLEAPGFQMALNDEVPLEAASVIKLPVMVEAFRQAEAGELSWDEMIYIRKEDKLPSCGALSYLHEGTGVTLKDAVTLMIILSDNTAANLMIDRLGADRINRTMRRLGLTGTRVERRLFDGEMSRRGFQNRVSARDMGRLLTGIRRRELISGEASGEMLAILSEQQICHKIPFFLNPAGIMTANKTGEDDGITNDVGIILLPDPVILCFLSNETDVPETERAIQDIAAIAAGLR